MHTPVVCCTLHVLDRQLYVTDVAILGISLGMLRSLQQQIDEPSFSNQSLLIEVQSHLLGGQKALFGPIAPSSSMHIPVRELQPSDLMWRTADMGNHSVVKAHAVLGKGTFWGRRALSETHCSRTCRPVRGM